MIVALLAGRLTDHLISDRKLPVVRVRSFAALVSSLGPGIALFSLAVVTPSFQFAIAMISFALSCLAFSYSGYHAYVQDVSGDRAGSVLALTNLCGILMGIAGNILSGYLMEFTGSFSPMFCITGAMFISSGVAWSVLMKGDVLF